MVSYDSVAVLCVLAEDWNLTYGLQLARINSHRLLDFGSGHGHQRYSHGYEMGRALVEPNVAELVSARLARALLADDSFKPAGDVAATLIPVKAPSTPENADIEVGGIFYGNARGTIQLPAGLHMVTISLPAYEEWSKKVLVQGGLSINATLPKRTDTRLEIKTE